MNELKKYEGKNGEIQFRDILTLKDGKFVETTISSLVIGEPTFLRLMDGRIVRTSSVEAWICYGDYYIQTKNHRYILGHIAV